MTPDDLRAARTRLGLSQRALADALDVPQATIARWETGVHKIEHAAILERALRDLARELNESSIRHQGSSGLYRA